jgi:hypothetical protein
MNRATLFVAFVVAVSSLVASPARAQQQPVRPAGTITRVYDIRDLIMDIRDFPFSGEIGLPADASSGGGGGGGQSLFGGAQAEAHEDRKEQTRGQRAQDLLRLITETVEPGSWRDAGGATGSVRELAGMLIITQTKEAQEAIASLLKQLRESNGAVRVQADWVLLNPEDVTAMILDAGEKGAPAAPKLIDPQKLANLPEGAAHYHAELSCFSGQTVSASSGRGRTVIYDQEPVVAQGSSAFGPSVRQVRSGVALEVTPLVIADAGSAVVEVGTKVAGWSDPSPATQPLGSAATTAPAGHPDGAIIERLNVVSQELHTTIRVPLNRPVLVGGMTLEPDTATPRGPQLYLILRVSAGQPPP